ncbi:MAG TPA: hypothetical protein VGG85_03540 [Terracidiphilus sp.]|jgi:predicted GH43/DUF377 family glycosyl hydrolase
MKVDFCGTSRSEFVFVWLGLVLALAGCSDVNLGLPPGAIGNTGKYNYSPSVIEQGNTRQFWWCSRGRDPEDRDLDTDAIFYASMNLSTRAVTSPVVVLAESPGTWDAAYTCNPKVIGGVFANPLGNGKTYSYAMYYVATSLVNGTSNSIGVAFSNDGVHWTKYPNPVISSSAPVGSNGYGVGQPALYNSDQKAAITMFYEDSVPSTHHVVALSKDGVHFTVQGGLTTNGLDPDNPDPIWGDVSFDGKQNEWYAIFNRPVRPQSTTGNVAEHGQYGIELYKIPANAIMTGSSPWQQLITIDTNSTGFESNFIAAFVHDLWGNLNVKAYPTVEMYTSVSYPSPDWNATPTEAGTSANFNNWIVYPMSWSPSSSVSVPFVRYFNGTVHEVTTGWLSPNGGFQSQEILGHLDLNPLHGATLPLYACKAGQLDYFVSLDVNCEGARILGKEGYGYSQATSGANLIAVYRCSTGHDHFVSKDPNCEGQKVDQQLGFVAP